MRIAYRIVTRMISNVQSMFIILSETTHINLLLENMGWCPYVLNMLNLLYLQHPSRLNVHRLDSIGVSTRETPSVPYSITGQKNVERDYTAHIMLIENTNLGKTNVYFVVVDDLSQVNWSPKVVDLNRNNIRQVENP